MTTRALRRAVLPLFLVAIVMSVPFASPVAVAAADYPLDATDTVIEDAVDYLLGEQGSDGSIDSFATSAWALMALAAAEEEDAVGDVIGYLEDEVDTGGFEATDWARMLLAIVAAGEDPEDFGGEDYIEGLLDTREVEDETGSDYNQIGEPDQLNDDFWGVIALAAANESIDDDIINFILEWQNDESDDTGWGIGTGDPGDVDNTAAAIMALVAADVAADTEIGDALDFLGDAQNDDGGFPEDPGDDSNVASTAWAILAIEAASDDPNGSTWEASDGTPIDYLLSLQDSNGSFPLSEDSSTNSEWMTAYAIPALLGEPYPVPAVDSSSGGGDGSIETSPSSLTFYATVDGGDPLDRELLILNGESGSIDWEVSDDAVWLSVSPASGSSDEDGEGVTVSVNIDGLLAGDYQAAITIESDDADNSPETVSVVLHVDAATVDDEIAAYPDDFEFSVDLDESDDNPEDQILEIWNTRPGNIEFEVDIDSDEDWLEVSPEDGDLDAEHIDLTLSVDIADLDPDDYTATISITSDDADTVEVDVSLDVTGEVEEAEIGFSPSKFEFEAEAEGDDPDEEILTIWNEGTGTLDWSVSDDADWLSLSPRNGESEDDDDEGEVELSVDISDLEPDDYTAKITIKGTDASNSPKTVTVKLTIEESDEEDDGDGGLLGHLLLVTTSPGGAGSVTPSVPMGSQGYPDGTTVTLTATAVQGYTFIGWSGNATGSDNPVNVKMTGDLNVTANFLLFDAPGLTNLSIPYASPGMASVSVIQYPTGSVPGSPSGFRVLTAYVVEPLGTGSFTLRFDGLVDANNVGVFKVVGNTWEQIPRAVVGTSAVQVTLDAADPIIALAYPGSAGILQSIKGLFGGASTTTIVVVAVGIVCILLIVVLLLALGRRETY
ncbi:MAG: hypothetical protein M0R22_12595 [Dehalococcoidia bacterium]|jgi:uncharacterized repeat protein (TIGR02543 family)|nr:hypothetical protein [Dehalococcoidia bacterium]